MLLTVCKLVFPCCRVLVRLLTKRTSTINNELQYNKRILIMQYNYNGVYMSCSVNQSLLDNIINYYRNN